MTKIYVFAALIFGLAQVGCHSSTVTDPNTLYVGLTSPPTNLDPRWASDANSQRLDGLIFSSLVRNGDDLLFAPQAATHWKIEDKKITFYLRKDLKFSNGQPLTAQDVIFSFSEYKKPGSPLAAALHSVESLEASDPYQLVLKLSENDGGLLPSLDDIKILPKSEIQKWGDRFGEHLMGSGPYQFVSINKNELVLKKSPFQAYANPKTENVIFKFIRDDNTRYLKMIKGDLDFLLNEVQEEKVTALKKSGKVNVLITPGLNFNYILFNLRDARLKSLELRRALFSALKRDEIIKYKLEDMATLATSIIAPPSPFYNPNLSLPQMSLEDARKTVENLGLKNTILSLETSDQTVNNGQILAQQLESLGLKVLVKSFEWGTFYSDLKMGRFEMATSRWVGIVDPDIYRESLDSHEFPPGHNRGYYDNKNFDKLVESARNTKDFGVRKNLYFKAEEIVAQDLPIIPLWYNANVSITSLRIKNFTPATTGSFFPLTEVNKE